MQDLLGLGGIQKLKAATGLAGGIGHRGAACGILVGGTLALGLASAEADETQENVAARGCTNAAEYVRRFRQTFGSTLCREITGTDFDDSWQLRKYLLLKSGNCMKAISQSVSILIDIVEQTDGIQDTPVREVNRHFSEQQFHCAGSVVFKASEQLEEVQSLSPHTLIPFNGGIGYSGSTCGALVGGCLRIGLSRGIGISQTPLVTTLRHIVATLLWGAKAFNDPARSPANDALLRCAELAQWFENTYRSIQCREITGTDFRDGKQATRYFEKRGISDCAAMAEETALKTAELTR